MTGTRPETRPSAPQETPFMRTQQLPKEPQVFGSHRGSIPDVEGDSMDFVSAERDLRSFNRAHAHSGRVKFLRVALPMVGVFIIAVLLGAYFWSASGLPEIAVDSAVMENDKMVMQNPELNGVDKDNRPYSLNARQAVTNPLEPKQVELKGIDARVPMDEGLFANITAGLGFYDADAKTLKLGGEIDVVTDDGMKMHLVDADVDMDAGSLKTGNPVTITTEQAVISSQRMFVEGNGEKVVFENRVKMTLYPQKLEQASNEQKASTQ